MKKHTRVGWTLQDGTPGTGITVSDEDDTGRILVAVDPLTRNSPVLEGRKPAQSSLEFHMVIFCTVTWLTPAT